ncbi:ABC transporter permease [Flavobacteriaceae bacterium]|nr:ABC transporter permease [Flavobacteriales bacterium]MBL6878077.1 ABC transporter permease [Flavobacteriaceae bacterium]MDA9849492.1 ABC transporter permease [Flavobacteriaceae bacterium]MDC0654577.1 ABC transporter permease [Flavobacteriaceae bacterium]
MYLLNKFLYSIITLFGVVTVIFFLFSVLPGDPAQMMLGQNDNSEQLINIKKKYAFDKPVSEQYLLYLNDLSPLSIHSKNIDDYTFLVKNKYNHKTIFQTNSSVFVIKFPYLRTSFTKQGKNVSEIIKNTLPNTLILAISSIFIAIVIGILFGVISALNKDRFIDNFIQFISTVGMSVPSFFSAIIFAWVFGFILNEYTNLNMTGNIYELDDFGEEYIFKLKNLILPSIVLGIRPLAVISQLMRNELLDVLSQDYIRTARSKGLTEYQIIKFHALKNSLNPVITAISGWFASMLAGAVFVEYIFGWNGLGKEIVNALNTLDLPVIMGSVLVIAFMFITINIIVDFVYRLLDPRVKLN